MTLHKLPPCKSCGRTDLLDDGLGHYCGPWLVPVVVDGGCALVPIDDITVDGKVLSLRMHTVADYTEDK